MHSEFAFWCGGGLKKMGEAKGTASVRGDRGGRAPLPPNARHTATYITTTETRAIILQFFGARTSEARHFLFCYLCLCPLLFFFQWHLRHAQHFSSLLNWLHALASIRESFRIRLSYRTAPHLLHLCLFSSECTIRLEVVLIYFNYIVDTGQCQHIDLLTLTTQLFLYDIFSLSFRHHCFFFATFLKSFCLSFYFEMSATSWQLFRNIVSVARFGQQYERGKTRLFSQNGSI